MLVVDSEKLKDAVNIVSGMTDKFTMHVEDNKLVVTAFDLSSVEGFIGRYEIEEMSDFTEDRVAVPVAFMKKVTSITKKGDVVSFSVVENRLEARVGGTKISALRLNDPEMRNFPDLSFEISMLLDRVELSRPLKIGAKDYTTIKYKKEADVIVSEIPDVSGVPVVSTEILADADGLAEAMYPIEYVNHAINSLSGKEIYFLFGTDYPLMVAEKDGSKMFIIAPTIED